MKTNEHGGSQSDIPVRFDLIPPESMLALAATFARGAVKYKPNNWRWIAREEHLNHAMNHIMLYLAGDVSEGELVNHLNHAMCRLVMARSHDTVGQAGFDFKKWADAQDHPETTAEPRVM